MVFFKNFPKQNWQHCQTSIYLSLCQDIADITGVCLLDEQEVHFPINSEQAIHFFFAFCESKHILIIRSSFIFIFDIK